MSSKPPPIPLFNFRKRQRQALVSDPQLMLNQLTSSSAVEKIKNNNNNPESVSTDKNDDDESLMGLFNENFTVDEKSNYESKSKFQQINRLGKAQQPMKTNSVNYGLQTSLPASSSSNFRSQRFQGSSRDSFTSRNKHFSKGNSVMNSQDKIPPSTNSGRGKGFGMTCRGRGRSESDPWKSSYYSNNSTISSGGATTFSGSENLQQDKEKYPRTTSNNRDNEKFMNRNIPALGGQLRVQSGTFQSRFGVQNTSQIQNAKEKVSTDTKCGKGQSSTVSFTPNRNNDVFTANKRTAVFDAKDVNYSKTTIPKPKPPPSPKRKPDTSLRLFTCPISLMRAWCSVQPFDGPIMFEVYGKVISATTSDKSGTGKEFVLQDDSSSIKCIFYEIDRELPMLIRGQIHRVVGTFDKKRGIMKIVSVRRATREEHQVYEEACGKTMEEMQKLGFHMNEP